ncbi:MAG: hypothetical protein ACFCVD_15105 [Nodosilinea sp.]
MTVAEVEASASIDLIVRSYSYGTGRPGNCAYAKPQAGPPELSFMIIDDRIARVDVSATAGHQVEGRTVAIEVESSQISTPEGIGLWASEAEVVAAYPEAEITRHGYVEGHYLTITDPDPPHHSIIFETDANQGHQVINFRSGRSPEVHWIEGCS